MNPAEQDNQRAIEWIEGVDACCFIDFPVSTARKAYVAGMNYERKEWEEKYKELNEKFFQNNLSYLDLVELIAHYSETAYKNIFQHNDKPSPLKLMIERVCTQDEYDKVDYKYCLEKAKALQEENKKLRECVGFYANRDSYDTTTHGKCAIVETDMEAGLWAGFPCAPAQREYYDQLTTGGKRARQCLEGLKLPLNDRVL